MTSAPSADLALRLEHLSVRYPRGPLALEDLSLVVGVGERVGLIGSSGAGKSSLINLINGRLLVEGAEVQGGVEVLGLDPRSLRSRARRQHGAAVGTIRQSLDLVGPLSVLHNVNAGRLGVWSTPRALASLVRPHGTDRVTEALIRVGLDPEMIRVRVDRLSGGQQQRVAVARLLVQEPRLVMADEPVASLDPELSELVLGLIAEGPWTLLVSLHQPELARRWVDRVIGLRRGRLVFDLPSEQLDAACLAALYQR